MKPNTMNCIHCEILNPSIELELERMRRVNNELRLRLEHIWRLYAELAQIAGEDVTAEHVRVLEALNR